MRRSRLGSEQFRKERQYAVRCATVNGTQPFDQADLVDGADLIENNLSGLPAKVNRQAGGIGPAFRRHWGDNHGVDVPIHFVRGNDETGASLSDFSAFGGIETNKMHLEAADYHCHASRSHREVEDPARSSRRSSPAWCMARKASSHPLRGLEAELTTNWFPWTSTSTGPSRWH